MKKSRTNQKSDACLNQLHKKNMFVHELEIHKPFVSEVRADKFVADVTDEMTKQKCLKDAAFGEAERRKEQKFWEEVSDWFEFRFSKTNETPEPAASAPASALDWAEKVPAPTFNKT